LIPRLDETLTKLKSLSDPDAVAGMARFGINPAKTLGISIPNLRKMAKVIGQDHELARGLWDTEIHEARILASMIDDPKLVDEDQLERWVRDFDSWDVCDQTIMNLFEDNVLAWDKAVEWSAARPEFVKRAGFVTMARLAVSDKTAGDERFRAFLPIINREATDERNYVKKAVNWALRQIGKRNLALNQSAIETAKEIRAQGNKAARWIAADALRELTSEAVRGRLRL
jgi:3-methyladenine DNA glycosylase AlkD